MAIEQPTMEQLAKREQIITGADTAPIYYANYLGVLATKGDIRLRFGQVGEATSEKLAVNVSAHVYVAPDHLLDFVVLLIGKMHQYGDMFPESAWERIKTQIQAGIGQAPDGEAKAE